MTYFYIEKRENDLKNALKIENQKFKIAEQEIMIAELTLIIKDIFKEILDNVDDEGNVNLNKSTMEKIRLIINEGWKTRIHKSRGRSLFFNVQFCT